MKRCGYVIRLRRSILPPLASCALLLIAAACGMGDSMVSDGATPVPTATAEVEDDAGVTGDTIVPTPVAEVEDDNAASSATPVPTPSTEAVNENETEVDSDEVYVYSGGHTLKNPAWSVHPSLDEQIFRSDVIVRATLKSATSTTEKVVGGYRAVHELRFTVHEYLKGSGPSEILVVVRDKEDEYSPDRYATIAKAQEVADSTMSRRNTAWDGRQGVLFLSKLDGSGYLARYAAATSTAFAIRTGAPYEAWWDYSVDTLSRGWLPAEKAGGSSEGGASGAASVAFVSGGSGFVTAGGSMTAYSTVTSWEIKSRIAQMAATLKAGHGIAGYRECINNKITRERVYRARVSWAPTQYTATLPSGSATGTEVYRKRKTSAEPKYIQYYVTGADKDHFHAPIVDEDSSAYNGYFRTLTIARPLPAGTYSVKYHMWHFDYFPCNYKPDNNYSEWTVTVTAPSGTVHEAFFDPASTSLGIGASGGQGTVSPASFNVGGATTTITRIVVSLGSMVSMSVSPSVSLSGKHVEFIKVDGTMAARLSFDAGDLKGGIGIGGAGSDTGTSTAEAGVSAEAHAEIAAAMAEAQATGSKMYFWFVSSAPWKAGDKLMLRIR